MRTQILYGKAGQEKSGANEADSGGATDRSIKTFPGQYDTTFEGPGRSQDFSNQINLGQEHYLALCRWSSGYHFLKHGMALAMYDARYINKRQLEDIITQGALRDDLRYEVFKRYYMHQYKSDHLTDTVFYSSLEQDGSATAEP